jgi:hypothetical protein
LDKRKSVAAAVAVVVQELQLKEALHNLVAVLEHRVALLVEMELLTAQVVVGQMRLLAATVLLV